MGKSKHLSLDGVRRAFHLIGDCRDVGHDRVAWVRRAVAGLRDELGAYMAVGVSLEGMPEANNDATKRAFVDIGWESSRDRETWLSLIRSGRFKAYRTCRAFFRQPGATVVVRSRDQLVSRRTWLLSAERNEDRLPLHQDESLMGRYHYGPRGEHLLFSINRAVGDREFDGRERAFLRLFLREVHHLAGTSLTMDEAGPFADLTPRVRAVLDALLEGDGEKQIAVRLGISRHTVHDHIKALYRRIGVGTRGELITLYFRANRPPDRSS